MIFNGDITVINRKYHKATRMDTWEYVPVKCVLWEESKKANVVKGGMEKADIVTIYIPFSSVPKDFTLQIGDKIAKGVVYDMDTAQCVTVTGIENYDYGSYDMMHWEVTAQ